VKFDWKRFCDDYGIPYVTQGPHTTIGNLSVKCPYCANADSSEHLGLKLDIRDPAWHCWRNGQHAGRNPRRLVQKLLQCSFADAQSIVTNQLVATPEQEELDKATEAMRPKVHIHTRIKAEPESTPLQMPLEFKPLNDYARSTSRYGDLFVAYLAQTRGFGTDTPVVAKQFDLRYVLTGDFAWRLIIPFYVDNLLIGWTGRDIRRNAHLRYRTHGDKRLIFNTDAVAGAKTLLITEGPLDAIKLHHYGIPQGYAAVATLGTAISPEQKPLLAQCIRKCESAVILFDRDTLVTGMTLAEELEALSGRPVRSRYLADYKDPGEIPAQLVVKVCEQMATI